MVSWSYWDRRFHRDPAILGKRIFYNDAPKIIIGVAPRAYVGPRVGSRTDLWIPAAHFGLTMLARLKPGVTIQQAQAEIAVLYQGLHEQDASRGRNPRAATRMELLPAGAGLVRVRDQYGKPLVLLTAVVGTAAAAGVHQHGEHAAGAIRGAPAGTGRARGAGRRPRPAGEADADRIAASFRSGRGGRRGGGVLRDRHPGAHHGEQPRIRAHRNRGPPRPEPGAFHRRNRAAHRPAVRPGAGMVRIPGGAGNGLAADRKGRRHLVLALVRKGPGGGAGGSLDFPGDRCRRISEPPRAAAEFRPGLSQRSRASGDARSLTQRVQARATGRALPGVAGAAGDHSAGALGLHQRLHSAARLRVRRPLPDGGRACGAAGGSAADQR